MTLSVRQFIKRKIKLMKTILLLPLSFFLSFCNLHAQTPVGCCNWADDGEAVTIKSSRANATVYYLDGIPVQPDQSITAEVLDQENGEPVYFANLRLYREKEFIRGAVVDETGFFTIEGRAGDLLEVSHVSYGKIRIPFEELAADPVLELKAGVDMEVVTVVTDRLPLVIGCYTTCCFCTEITEELVEERPKERQEEADWNWSYYPNPTQEHVFLQTGEKQGIILLYAMDGRLIRQQTIRSTEEMITLAGLPSATYLLLFQGEEGQESIGQVVLVN
jgi:hypothetical protein